MKITAEDTMLEHHYTDTNTLSLAQVKCHESELRTPVECTFVTLSTRNSLPIAVLYKSLRKAYDILKKLCVDADTPLPIMDTEVVLPKQKEVEVLQVEAFMVCLY